ncbi:MAG TPA: hypothetical protein VMF89_04035, partial [Polyangiales bacterium]|nr:hypothetical protein [Polyangiales bacterium]
MLLAASSSFMPRRRRALPWMCLLLASAVISFAGCVLDTAPGGPTGLGEAPSAMGWTPPPPAELDAAGPDAAGPDAAREGGTIATGSGTSVEVDAGICQAGTSECVDARTSRSCDAQGRWAALETCGAACVSGRCAECEPNSAECAAEGRRACDSAGRWSAATACEHGCSAG